MKHYYYIMYLLSITAITTTKNSFIKKIYHQASWLIISYELYNKTQKLIQINHNPILENNGSQLSDNITFFYECFIKAAEQTMFDEQLYYLKRAWKSWNRKLSSPWAKEYSIILFHLYKKIFESKLKHLLNKNNTKKVKKYSLEELWLYINLINATLQSLPLEAILETIDLISEAIPIFFDTYSAPSRENWLAWIRSYWWAIFITTIPISLKIILIFKNYYKRESISPYLLAPVTIERYFNTTV